MFKGISFKTFLDTVEEWHALVLGFCEVIAPWPPRHPTLSAELYATLWNEHHYYVFGQVLGILGWLGIAIIIKKFFF